MLTIIGEFPSATRVFPLFYRKNPFVHQVNLDNFAAETKKSNDYEKDDKKHVYAACGSTDDLLHDSL